MLPGWILTIALTAFSAPTLTVAVVACAVQRVLSPEGEEVCSTNILSKSRPKGAGLESHISGQASPIAGVADSIHQSRQNKIATTC